MNPINTTLTGTLATRNRYFWLIIFVLFELLMLYAFIQGNFGKVLIGAVILTLLLFSAFSVERSFYLLILYFFASPMKYYDFNFPNWKIFFSYYFGWPLFAWLLGFWLIYLIYQQTPNQLRSDSINSTGRITFKTMDKLFFVFVGTFTISAILGWLRGLDRIYWAQEYFGLLLYLGYFIYLYSPLSKNHQRLFDFIVFCSMIISFQFFQSLLHFGGRILLYRIVSQHIHIAQTSLSYLAAVILYTSSKSRRISSSIFFLIILFSTVITQQRSLWLGVFVAIVILLLFLVYERRKTLFKNFTKIIYGFIAAGFGLGGFYIIMQTLTRGKFLVTMLSRLVILFSPGMLRYDLAGMIRFYEIKEILRSIGNDFLFGKGLGEWMITRWRDIPINTVDNSYIYLYWKTGLFGLIAFLILMIYILYRSITTLRKNLLTDEKIFVLASLTNLVGLLIIGFFDTCIGHYRFIIGWAATFGVVESIARKYDKRALVNYKQLENSIT